MSKRYKPVDLAKLRTYSIDDRAHKFDAHAVAGLPQKDASFADWWNSLPPQLGAAALREFTNAVLAARKAQRPVIFALGAHVVKVGCSSIVCDLIRRKLVTAVAMNGATAIHDVETALFGRTSEDVADTIRDGRFGMVSETPRFFADALRDAGNSDDGLGAHLARHLVTQKAPNLSLSILAAAHEAAVPATVHVAIGTDTIHMHAPVAESCLLQQSAIDFRLICDVVADMAPPANGQVAPGDSTRRTSGVWCNVGSAVLLPEVFLKAVAVARNLGANLDDITTANFDMIRHYRPSENVIGRPVKKGRGYHFAGHHEIMLPLLRQALVESQP